MLPVEMEDLKRYGGKERMRARYYGPTEFLFPSRTQMFWVVASGFMPRCMR